MDCLLVLVEILSSSFDSYYPFSRCEVHVVSDEQPWEWYFRAENPCAVNCVGQPGSHMLALLY